jgi:uncharacterized membrane protein SpoIIM required for sporulation
MGNAIFWATRYDKVLMKETRFIRQNEAKWAELEALMKEPEKNAGKQGDLFTQVTDDLSYARTYYPNRLVRAYLNTLSRKIFSGLLKTEHTYVQGFKDFWLHDLPAMIYLNRRSIMISLLIFAISFVIGVVSSAHDPAFSSAILGEEYVEMTNQNISKGDPMAVYKDDDALMMFLRIFWNNLRVALLTFIFGLCFSVGTLGIMVYNGIMVGAFQYFFFSRGVFIESFLSIWMHGTMEISCIIMAGGAGLVMGNGLVYPGTYTRLQSLRISARSGIQMMAGIIPFIFLAALIESYVTRLTDLDHRLRFLMILLQALIMVLLFFWLPFRKGKKGIPFRLNEAQLPATKPFEPLFHQVKSTGQIFGDTFRIYGNVITNLGRKLVLLAILFSIAVYRFTDDPDLEVLTYNNWYFNNFTHLLNFGNKPVLILIGSVLLSLAFTWFGVFWKREFQGDLPVKLNKLQNTIQLTGKWAGSVIINLPLFLMLLPDRSGWIFILLPAPFFLIWNIRWQTGSHDFARSFLHAIQIYFTNFLGNMRLYYSFLLMCALFLLLTASISSLLSIDLLRWFYVIDNYIYTMLYHFSVVAKHFIALVLLIPLFMVSTAFYLISLDEMKSATGLKEILRKEGLIRS